MTIAAALASLAWAAPAEAGIRVYIDKSSQSMTVSVDGGRTFHWPVSTGRGRYDTPAGQFRAIRLARVYYSKKYDDAPMPNSVFFYGGYAIHGTYEEGKLGRPASHGCVRLSRAHAAMLFELVRVHGMNNTSIAIGGSIGADTYAARRAPERTAPATRGRAYGAVEYRDWEGDLGRPRASRRVRVYEAAPPVVRYDRGFDPYDERPARRLRRYDDEGIVVYQDGRGFRW
ncbi:MAG: L,D-transpeptidase [Xanthobacteraceae bacterium]|uniref:L,D-transpeptidase n=1 Tax=Pseudolabrys sp. TaxID=1960880 RepID=UPI003D113310